MFSHKLAFLFPLALVASINAQSSSSATTSATSVPSSPGGISPCILQCVTTAAEQNGCQSFADISCVCTSIPFQQASLACLQANCTSDDVTTATQLQQSECGSGALFLLRPRAFSSGLTLALRYSFQSPVLAFPPVQVQQLRLYPVLPPKL
ncbi:hypothetical protein K435DRAFT_650810 [Dendrothele bispora CBS 962.96]|uniref:CFEM domain-containing protein n=1 Tax=Dendrothele bispora (strain CBS 962.96) TaxID=1314807 RepID=A0A4S8MLA8_DENBC|nr:hypothetical protein K435DRAFT_650810 [Dendrothele bispora CBS 962.96]